MHRIEKYRRADRERRIITALSKGRTTEKSYPHDYERLGIKARDFFRNEQ